MANEVRITVGADTKSAEQNIKSFRSRMDGIGGGAIKAGAGLSAMGATGVVAIKGLIGAALEQQKAEAGVEVAVRNSGESYAVLKDQIAEATSALQKKSKFGDEVQMQALSQLIPMMGSTEGALKALNAVNEVAAVTQTDLLSAVRSVGPALAGQTQRIRGTALEFDAAMGPMERADAVMAAIGGTAESQVDPFHQMSMAMGDFKEVLGEQLIPLLTPFVQKITSIIEKLQNMNPVVKQVGMVFLLVATALGAIGGPLLLFIGLLFKMIPALLGVNMAAGPLMLIVIGVTAAITAAILVWKNWDKVVLFVKEQINKFIGVLNDKVIPILNNLIKAFNFITRSSVDTIEPLKKLDTTVKEVAETTEKAADNTDKFKHSMKDLSDFAHITNDELGEMIDSTDKATVAFGGLSGSLTAFGKAPDVRKPTSARSGFGSVGGGMGVGGMLGDIMGMTSGADIIARVQQENMRLRGLTGKGVTGASAEAVRVINQGVIIGSTDDMDKVVGESVNRIINGGWEFA